MKGTLTKFAADTKLGGVPVCMLEDRAAGQGNLDSWDERMDKDLMKFSKDKL